eukprot:scaffold43563_cov60-Cyclotella_meneghiniana.AAC.1
MGMSRSRWCILEIERSAFIESSAVLNSGRNESLCSTHAWFSISGGWVSGRSSSSCCGSSVAANGGEPIRMVMSLLGVGMDGTAVSDGIGTRRGM